MPSRTLAQAILTVLKDRIANKLAIMVENPGARQLCAMKPNFSSARQITSSPCFQSHDGMFSKYALTRLYMYIFFKYNVLYHSRLAYLIVVLHKLNNDTYVVAVVLN